MVSSARTLNTLRMLFDEHENTSFINSKVLSGVQVWQRHIFRALEFINCIFPHSRQMKCMHVS